MKVSLVSWEGKLEFRSLVVEWGAHGRDQEGGRGHREREREKGSRERSAVCLAQALSVVPGAD